jgi:hypothetical protein
MEALTAEERSAIAAKGGHARAGNMSAAARSRSAKKASAAARKKLMELTPEERTERARAAVQARWAKRAAASEDDGAAA